MKFSALVVIIEDKYEEKAIKVAKDAGAGGVTVIHGRSIGLEEKKVFFGLTLEENVSLLLFILPMRVSLNVMRTIKDEFDFQSQENKGIAFTLPLSHIVGLDIQELHKFENEVKDLL
ncbi:Nitrogen regulatory protein P-II [hydrothermal vent metagenome]|uniref:Nitrogen regulatory protein P-II n=1 Tax=hydrothermal vent metagenome TaxID=652676 RepID=A0A1W1C4I1_9ZZZZ